MAPKTSLGLAISCGLAVAIACSDDSEKGTQDDPLTSSSADASGGMGGTTATGGGGGVAGTGAMTASTTEDTNTGGMSGGVGGSPEVATGGTPGASGASGGAGGVELGGASGGSGMAGASGAEESVGGAGGSGTEEEEAPLFVAATLLSETGLYADVASEELGPNVFPFTPRFPLWTDGAEKRRWIYLPEGTQIDTSDMDEWEFPLGTKIWKEFVKDGIRIETRLLEKTHFEAPEAYDGWYTMAFVWNEDQTDAVAMPEGLPNAMGTTHDVPDQESCLECHDSRKEKPLGPTAIQLTHDGDGLTMATLIEGGWLTEPPETPLVVPGTELDQEALGYLHANCGHCHRDRAPANSRVRSLQLWLESDQMATVEETNAYQALVGFFIESEYSEYDYRVNPGDPDTSEALRRMLHRGDGSEDVKVQMPPLGSEFVDEEGSALISEWIQSLPPMIEQ